MLTNYSNNTNIKNISIDEVIHKALWIIKDSSYAIKTTQSVWQPPQNDLW